MNKGVIIGVVVILIIIIGVGVYSLSSSHKAARSLQTSVPTTSVLQSRISTSTILSSTQSNAVNYSLTQSQLSLLMGTGSISTSAETGASAQNYLTIPGITAVYSTGYATNGGNGVYAQLTETVLVSQNASAIYNYYTRSWAGYYNTTELQHGGFDNASIFTVANKTINGMKYSYTSFSYHQQTNDPNRELLWGARIFTFKNNESAEVFVTNLNSSVAINSLVSAISIDLNGA